LPARPAIHTRRSGRCCIATVSHGARERLVMGSGVTSGPALATCCTWIRRATHALSVPGIALQGIAHSARAGGCRRAHGLATRSRTRSSDSRIALGLHGGFAQAWKHLKAMAFWSATASVASTSGASPQEGALASTPCAAPRARRTPGVSSAPQVAGGASHRQRKIDELRRNLRKEIASARSLLSTTSASSEDWSAMTDAPGILATRPSHLLPARVVRARRRYRGYRQRLTQMAPRRHDVAIAKAARETLNGTCATRGRTQVRNVQVPVGELASVCIETDYRNKDPNAGLTRSAGLGPSRTIGDARRNRGAGSSRGGCRTQGRGLRSDHQPAVIRTASIVIPAASAAITPARKRSLLCRALSD
jgi:hypothetical protein